MFIKGQKFKNICVDFAIKNSNFSVMPEITNLKVEQ